MSTSNGRSRMHRRPILLAIASTLALHAAALAQVRLGSNVHESHKWTWNENLGWVNWRDGTGNGMNGARFHPGNKGFISGYIWSENIGWIHLGDAADAEATPNRQYPNSNGTNYGVNILPSRHLSGFAWSENAGWINFGSEPTVGVYWAVFEWGGQPPTQGTAGDAWSETLGWINLSDPTSYVALGCRSDLDDGSSLGNPDGGVDINDLIYFLRRFEQGC